MAMRPCVECGKMISTWAQRCPHCGRSLPTPNRQIGAAFSVVGCLLCFLLILVLIARGCPVMTGW